MLSRNHRHLFAVNAGSDQVSAFGVTPSGLSLLDVASSGGSRPISLTVHGQLLYVLNAEGTGNITGFRIAPSGKLTPIPGSTRPLSSAASGPAQVEFSPQGDLLVVTEKATSRIDTYRVDANGVATGPLSQPSAGTTPFGFAFDHRGRFIVSEAFASATGASAASSYQVADDGTLRVISASVPTTQTAACWFVVTKDGRFAYTSNTGSGSISSYQVAHDGALTLLKPRAGVTGDGSAPTDLALSRNARHLYALNSALGTISAFRVRADGSLAPLAGVGGLGTSAVGIAAR